MKHVLKSKMVWFNLLYTVGEVAAYLADYLPPEYIPVVVATQGVANIILRIWFTNTGVSFKITQ